MQHAILHASSEPSPSLRELYDEHLAYVRAVVARRGVPNAAIDDIVQDVFTAVFLNLPTFSGEIPIQRWIGGITRNIVCMHFRKREQRTCMVELDEQSDGIVPSDSSEDRLDRKAMLARLEEALAHMTESQRHAYWLYEIEEMPGSEVARTLGITENSVRMRVRAARRQLARLLDLAPSEGEALRCAG